jgi:Holliday junction DNA helicase RuvA
VTNAGEAVSILTGPARPRNPYFAADPRADRGKFARREPRISAMISKISGVLESVEGSVANVRVDGGFTYEVLVSGYTAARLGDGIGQPITLHTLNYIESQDQGASFLPRLAGFLTVEDRRFFELFTTTKGIGKRKALRALAMSTDQVAAAIADRDLALLQSLPEIGRRLAETVIATLHGKVDKYVVAAYETTGVASGGGNGKPGKPAARTLAKEALEVLLQLGENRTQAVTWIDEALRDEADKPRDVQAVIAKVYRIKSGA